MSTQFPSNNPTAYFGIAPTNPGQNWIRERNPNSTDYKNYHIGDRWININNNTSWTLVANAAQVATWVETSAEFATNAETIAGTVTDKAVTPISLVAKLGPQTAHGVLIGEGTSSAIASTTAGTAGQVLQSGGAAADPSFTSNISSNAFGVVSTPLQSGVSAYLSATVPNVTGDNTTYTIPFDTVAYDIQSEYNPATGVFTAKTAGVYLVSVLVNFSSVDAAHTTGNVSIVGQQQFNPAAGRDAVNQFGVCQSRITKLAVGGTIQVSATITGGAKTAGVMGTTSFSQFQVSKIA